MNIIIIAATKLEINNFLSKINYNELENIELHKHKIDILITGVGLVFTTYNITKTLINKTYDLYINIGIAGSFNKNLELGEVVYVFSEEFSDLGAERSDGFKTIFDLGFMCKNEFPFENGKLVNKSKNIGICRNLTTVSAISGNMAHGNKQNIKSVYGKFQADIETMEGAAFFYVCIKEGLNFLQIRSISNYVESYNRKSWDIPLALNSLSDFLIDFIKKL